MKKSKKRFVSFVNQRTKRIVNRHERRVLHGIELTDDERDSEQANEQRHRFVGR